MKTKIFLCLIAILVGQSYGKSQDQNYSQFFNNGLYYNPAYAGFYEGIRTFFNYRNQWTNLPYDFRSYNVAMDLSARNILGGGGLGFIMHSNKEGEGMVQNLYGGLMLSVRHASQRENRIIQFGITTALAQKKIDWDGLVFPDQLDGKYGNIHQTRFTDPIRSSTIYPDFNVGGIFHFNFDEADMRIGSSLHHFFQPKIGFVNTEYQLKMKFVSHFDVTWHIQQSSSQHWIRRAGEEAKINFATQFENQYGANTFVAGLNAYKSYIYLGLWYRNEDISFKNINTVVFLIGVLSPFTDDSRLKIFYSYDYILNKLMATGGTHEISVVVELRNQGSTTRSFGGRTNGSRIGCPQFF